jgi:hypothetical protein
MIEMIGEVVFVLVPFLLIHMSLIKLKKSNRRPIPVPQSQRQHKPVFLGDSSDFAVQYITGANKYKRILKEILAAEVHTSFSLGDSIGKRLQQQSYHIQHREIGWWCGWGRNSNKAVKWMSINHC